MIDAASGGGLPGRLSAPNPRSRSAGAATPRWLVAVLLTALIAGCSDAVEQLDLSEFLPVARTVVPGSVLFPTDPPAALLGGSLRVRGEDGPEPVLVMRGHAGRIGFEATAALDLELALEIRQSPADIPDARLLTLSVNGRTALEAEIGKRWQTVTIPVGREQLRNGVNELGLRLEKVATDPADRPLVAVRIRSLRLRAPGGPGPWPDRPDSIRSRAGEAASAGELLLPVRSSLDLALVAGRNTRIRGRLTTEPARGQRAGPLRASIRVVGGVAEAPAPAPAGGDEPAARPGHHADELLFEAELEPGDEIELDVDLARFAGSPLLLRFEVTGGTNGVLTWAEARLEYRVDDAPVVVPGTPRNVEPPASGGRYAGHDVLVVVLDAARADAWSAYGARRPTPEFDRVAADSTLFEWAATAAPWTAPSLTSLLTGLQADAHGVEAWDQWLPKPVATLGERFRTAGYRTVIFSQHLLYRTNPTLRRGFDHIVQVDPEQRDRLPAASELFDGERPTFALIHLLVPHAPYVAPPPHRDRYASPTGDPTAADDPSFAQPFQRDWDPLVPGADELRLMRDRYDEMVSWSDALLGRIVETLRSAGRYEEALLVVTGDHGEAFHEHGELLHTRSLHDEVLRVPLLVKLPGGQGAGDRISRPVGLVDVAATLADAAGLERPPRLAEAAPVTGMQGRSLIDLLAVGGGGASDSGERAGEAWRGLTPDVYATTRSAIFRRQTGHRLLALRAGRFKLIHDTLWGRDRLYDMEQDAGESDDLAPGLPAVAAWLRQAALAQHALDATLAATYSGGDPTGAQLDLDQLRQLEALGYIQ